MKAKLLIVLGCIQILTSCTTLNKKCGYLPPGECWGDDYSCPPYSAPIKNSTICNDFWSCGYNHQDHDPY